MFQVADEISKLIGSVRAGDTVAFEVIASRFRPLLISTVNGVMSVRAFSLSDSDRDDLMQEALLALYKAVCSYKEQDKVRFGLYAKV